MLIEETQEKLLDLLEEMTTGKCVDWGDAGETIGPLEEMTTGKYVDWGDAGETIGPAGGDDHG